MNNGLYWPKPPKRRTPWLPIAVLFFAAMGLVAGFLVFLQIAAAVFGSGGLGWL